MRWHWVVMLLLSVLLHLIFIGSVSDLIAFPSKTAPQDHPASSVVSAALIAPPAPPPAMPQVKAATIKPKPVKRPPPAEQEPAPNATPLAKTAGTPTGEPEGVTTEAASPSEQPENATTENGPASESSPTYRIALLPSAQLKFDIEKTPANGASMHGSGTIDWQTDQQRYEINGDFGVLFITALRFKSRGTIEQTGIAPELYAEKRMRRSETNTHFHRERHTISFSASTNSYPRLGDEQDRASIIWQVAAIGRGDPAQFYPGAVIPITVAGTRDATPWQITIVGNEQIDVDGKPLAAWRLLRAPRPGSYDQTLEFWLAPEIGWYPVRLRYTEPNGDVLDMVMRRLNVSAPLQSD